MVGELVRSAGAVRRLSWLVMVSLIAPLDPAYALIVATRSAYSPEGSPISLVQSSKVRRPMKPRGLSRLPNLRRPVCPMQFGECQIAVGVACARRPMSLVCLGHRGVANSSTGCPAAPIASKLPDQ